MFQLQQIVTRPMQVFVDARQLKICATCFEIAVGLLRTLEMIVSLVPELVTDFAKPSAELLLGRLCQVRVAAKLDASITVVFDAECPF